MKRALKKVPERDIYSPLSEYEIYLPEAGFFFGDKHLIADWTEVATLRSKVVFN